MTPPPREWPRAIARFTARMDNLDRDVHTLVEHPSASIVTEPVGV